MDARKLQAVIFDMDGLMIDSEQTHSRSLEIVLNSYGIKPELNKYGIIQTLGIGVPSNWEKLKKKYSLKPSVGKLTEEKHAAYEKLIPEIQAMPGLGPLLKELGSVNLKMAVASGESMKNIKTILKQLKIIDYFDALVSGEEVDKPKPNPDIFLEAAKQLVVDPKNCLVLEDAPSGIEAAKRANMHAVAVYSEFNHSENFENADKIYQSLEAISAAKLMSLTTLN